MLGSCWINFLGKKNIKKTKNLMLNYKLFHYFISQLYLAINVKKKSKLHPVLFIFPLEHRSVGHILLSSSPPLSKFFFYNFLLFPESSKKPNRKKRNSFVTTDGMLGKQPPQDMARPKLNNTHKAIQGAQAKDHRSWSVYIYTQWYIYKVI